MGQEITTSVGVMIHHSRRTRLESWIETLSVYKHGAASVIITDLQGKMMFHGHWAAGTEIAAAISDKARQIDEEEAKTDNPFT